MKRILFSIGITLIAATSFAQLPNLGFDTWQTDTSIFGYLQVVPTDTFTIRKPVGWYSVNAITGNQYIGGKSLVSEVNATALFGSASVKLVTDSLNVTGAGLKLIVPGFIVNGNFKVSLIDLLQNNTSLSPSEIPGAGTPINSRKQKLKAYIQYNPIQGDSLLIWAVLKKKDTIVAEAKMHYKQTASSTILIEQDFVYTSCAIPDTAVLMIASSTPDFSTALGGATGIEAGSQMIIDSVMLTEMPQGFVFPPFANRDKTFTNKNAAKTITVLANDYDCSATAINITNVGTPLHGTAVKNANNTIIYTPANNYIGTDSFKYTINNVNGTASTYVFISVFSTVGIEDEAVANAFILYPNPTRQTLMLDLAVNTLGTATIFDLNGKAVLTNAVNTSSTLFDVSKLAKGIYVFQLKTDKGVAAKRLVIE